MSTFRILTLEHFPGGELDNGFVDEGMLGKGIYLTDMPTMHKSDLTIEKMIEIHKYIFDLKEDDEWCENIRKCKLTDVNLTLI